MPPGDSIQTDFFAQRLPKVAVLKDLLSVLQDSKTWEPLHIVAMS